jgi:hypothetical protein
MYLVNGSSIEADWELGKASNEQYTFKDGLKYKIDSWDYCTVQDRRFYSERVNGFQPDEPQLSDTKKKGLIPFVNQVREECFYDQNEETAFDYDLNKQVLGKEELQFIESKTYRSKNPAIYQ